MQRQMCVRPLPSQCLVTSWQVNASLLKIRIGYKTMEKSDTAKLNTENMERINACQLYVVSIKSILISINYIQFHMKLVCDSRLWTMPSVSVLPLHRNIMIRKCEIAFINLLLWENGNNQFVAVHSCWGFLYWQLSLFSLGVGPPHFENKIIFANVGSLPNVRMPECCEYWTGKYTSPSERISLISNVCATTLTTNLFHRRHTTSIGTPMTCRWSDPISIFDRASQSVTCQRWAGILRQHDPAPLGMCLSVSKLGTPDTSWIWTIYFLNNSNKHHNRYKHHIKWIIQIIDDFMEQNVLVFSAGE